MLISTNFAPKQVQAIISRDTGKAIISLVKRIPQQMCFCNLKILCDNIFVPPESSVTRLPYLLIVVNKLHVTMKYTFYLAVRNVDRQIVSRFVRGADIRITDF